MPDHLAAQSQQARLRNLNLHIFNNSIAAMLVRMLAVTLSLR